MDEVEIEEFVGMDPAEFQVRAARLLLRQAQLIKVLYQQLQQLTTQVGGLLEVVDSMNDDLEKLQQ